MRRISVFIVMATLTAATSSAQVTPAAGFTPPDDTPAIRVGMTLFPTYTFQTDPKIKIGRASCRERVCQYV